MMNDKCMKCGADMHGKVGGKFTNASGETFKQVFATCSECDFSEQFNAKGHIIQTPKPVQLEIFPEMKASVYQ